MLSVSNVSASQASSYYTKDDYYTEEEQQSASCWFGKGAKALGMSGKVEKEAFANLLSGISPDGEELFSRAIAPEKRRAGMDCTFSAPKSVSIAALVQQDKRVLEAHQQAVASALTILESRYAQTRISTPTGRQRLTTGNLIAAAFTHATNREEEPQLHSHCVVMNATQLPDGRWYSFSNEEVMANQKLLGQIYQNELATSLKRLGYEVHLRPHGQFDLEGYSPQLLQTFSSRRKQIEALVADWKGAGTTPMDANGQENSTDAARREAATLRSRKRKAKAIAQEKLVRGWVALLKLKGIELPPAPSQDGVSQKYEAGVEEDAGAAVTTAIQHCGEREAVFKKTQIERFVLEHHLGEYSFDAIQAAIAHHAELIQVEPGKYTTQAALSLELDTIRLMQSRRGKMGAIASPAEVPLSLETKPFTSGQRQAIQLTVTTPDQFIAWQGIAGSGKTFALNAVKEFAQSQGFFVRGLAPSAEAAHSLCKALEIEAETVAGLLCSQESATTPEIWIVDEAGLLSMKDAHDLLRRAIAEDVRVFLVGDTRQLSAVGAGNPFKSLQAGGIAIAHLDENLRQQKQELRSAVRLLAQGEVSRGIQVLDEAGCVREIASPVQLLCQIAQDYVSLSPEERGRTLLLAETNRERAELTRQIRQGFQLDGSLGSNVFTVAGLRQKDLTTAQAAYVAAYEPSDVLVPLQDYKKQGLAKNQQYVVIAKDREANRLTLETPAGLMISVDPSRCGRKTAYQTQQIDVAVGDRLRWTRNNRTSSIRNGQTFTVTQISPDGTAQITDAEGKQRQVSLTGRQYIDYAWVSTTYSSQGKTADRVLALVDGMTSKESFYVAVSRAKHHLTLYTSDKTQLMQLAQKSRAKENVSDYIPLVQGVNHHAQTPQKNHSPATSSPNYWQRLGESIGERICQRLTASTDRTDECERENPAGAAGNAAFERDVAALAANLDQHLEPLARAIADYAEREELSECVGDLAGAAAAVDRSLEQLAGATESRTRLAAAVDRLNQAIGEQIGWLQSSKQLDAERLQQPAELAAFPGIEESQKSMSKPSQLTLGKEHYQAMWRRYSQGIREKDLVKLDRRVAWRAFEDGQESKAIALMLVAGSAFVRQIEQSRGSERARQYVKQMVQAMCQSQYSRNQGRKLGRQMELS